MGAFVGAWAGGPTVGVHLCHNRVLQATLCTMQPFTTQDEK